MIGTFGPCLSILKSTSDGMVELDAMEVAKFTTRVGLMIALRAAGMTARSDDASARIDLDRLPLLVGAAPNMTPSQVWTSAVEPGIADYRRVSASHDVRLVAKRSASGRIRALDFKVEKLFDVNGVHETVKQQVPLSFDPPTQPVLNDKVESDDGDPGTTEQIRQEIAERRASRAEPFDVKSLFPALEPYPDGEMTEDERMVIINDQIARRVFDNAAHTRFCMSLVAQVGRSLRRRTSGKKVRLNCDGSS